MIGMIGSMNAWSALRRVGRAALLAAFLPGFGTTLAIAEQDQQAPKAQKSADDYSAWVKVCTKSEQAENKPVCLIKYEDLDPKTGNVLLAVAVRATEGDDRQELLVNVPTGYSLVMPAGVRIKIDEHEPISVQYAICLPTNCQVRTELTKQTLNRMRKGKLMLVGAINAQQKALTFPVPLNGFSKTSDGAAVDTATYQETRRRMLEFAKKTAEGQRQGQQPGAQSSARGSPVQAATPNALTTVPKITPAPAQ
jgi:invasion protein IalB